MDRIGKFLHRRSFNASDHPESPSPSQSPDAAAGQRSSHLRTSLRSRSGQRNRNRDSSSGSHQQQSAPLKAAGYDDVSQGPAPDMGTVPARGNATPPNIHNHNPPSYNGQYAPPVPAIPPDSDNTRPLTGRSTASSGSAHPIADQFSSSSYYHGDTSPTAPAFDQSTSGPYKSPTRVSSQPLPAHPAIAGSPNSIQDREYPIKGSGSARNSNSYSPLSSYAQRGRIVDEVTAGNTRSTDPAAPTNGSPHSMTTHTRNSIPRKSIDSQPARRNVSGQLDSRVDGISPIRNDVGHGLVQGTNNLSLDDESMNASRATSAYTASAVGPVHRGPQQVYAKRTVMEGSDQPPSLEGIVDLTNTSDTTVHTYWADPVVHEHIKPTIHHVEHRAVQRDIHTHDIHHRMLPVHDTQVLPAKHYAPAGPKGELIEVHESTLPGRTGANSHWVVADTLTGHSNSGQSTTGQPRAFTARTFTGTEGDERSYTSAAGIPTKENTYVHAPRIATGAQAAGQTVPVHLGRHTAADVHSYANGTQAVPNEQHNQQGAAETVVRAARRAGGVEDNTKFADSGSDRFSAMPRHERERESEAVVAARAAASG